MKPSLSRLLSALLVALCAASAARAADLTDTERRWIAAAGPVIAYARQQGLPLDIVVQPQDAAGLAPLATGYVQGRCKLVLSMRGNPEAETTLDDVPADLAPVLIEAMAAHELGHCWRYVRGVWHALPAGFVDRVGPAGDDARLAALRGDMRAARREEGYADLVALAWTREHHPDRYAETRAWLEAVRTDDLPAGSHHDTRVWLHVAGDAAAFPATGTVFEQAMTAWTAGLAQIDKP